MLNGWGRVSPPTLAESHLERKHMNKKYVSIWKLHKLLKAPEFETQSAITTETIRRRAHRGVYGEMQRVNTGGANRYLIDLNKVRENLFPSMGEDEFFEIIKRNY